MAGLCQIIQDDYTFSTSCEEDLSNLEGDFLGLGLDYNVVSILGPQSSGKSTLLNHSFNTNFATMDPMQRRQTTKGLWLSYDSAKRALVMDVEGTDSAERGEEHISFDRKSALYALALSEVLIVNMWAHDVGRHNAANYDTFRLVFEVNLELFSTRTEQSPKTLLLFILRDHKETPLENLEATLRRDLQKIWADIDKSDEHRERDITEFFDFEFTSLPDYHFARDQFVEAAQNLAERFQHRDRPDSFFKMAYHKHIPADAFPQYASDVWDKVTSNEKLMLPSEMQARCEDIANKAIAKFVRELEGVRAALEHGAVVQSVGQQICERREAALAMYDDQASTYLEHVYQERRDQLLNDVDNLATGMKKQQFENLLLHNRKTRDDTLGHSVTRILRTWQQPDLKKVINEHVDASSRTLQPAIRDLSLGDNAWQDQLKARLQDQALEVARQRCEMEIANVGTSMRERFNEHFLRDENGCKREWLPDVDIEEMYTQALGKAATVLDVLGDAMEVLDRPGTLLTGEDRQKLLDKLAKDVMEQVDGAKRLQDLAIEVARQRREMQIANLGTSMRERFDEHFQLDENGCKREWLPDVDIEAIYTQALGKAATVLDVPKEAMAGRNWPVTPLTGEDRQRLLAKLAKDVKEQVEGARREEALARDKRDRDLSRGVGDGAGLFTAYGIYTAVAGANAAGISGGLAAVGGFFGGGMALGICVTAVAPVAVAATTSAVVYRAIRRTQ